MTLSLVTRLTFSVVVLIMFACGGVVFTLYNGLQKELIRRDEQTLINRAGQIAQLLQDGAPAQSLPRYFNRMMDTSQDVLIIQPQTGPAVVMNHTGITLPQMSHNAATGKMVHITDPQGVDIAMLTIAGTSAGMPVTLTVARAAHIRGQMLKHYRRQSLLVCGAAIVLCLLFSPWLIRRGLGAIGELSAMTARTRTARLHEPLPLGAIPRELLPLGKALNTMRQRLAEDVKRLSQFSDDLAHEMRTPVSILLGQNQVALSQPRTVAHYQQVIADNIDVLESMSQLIDNILFLARADHQNVALRRQSFPLDEVLDDICDYLQPLADERNLALCADVTGMLYADRSQFQRAMINLLTNAIRHAPEGGRVWIRQHTSGHFTVIEVGNPGQMVADADVLFRRFWRGDNARHSPGTGLGLSMVQAIARLHGGSAGYRHQHGDNIFFCRFPINADGG